MQALRANRQRAEGKRCTPRQDRRFDQTFDIRGQGSENKHKGSPDGAGLSCFWSHQRCLFIDTSHVAARQDKNVKRAPFAFGELAPQCCEEDKAPNMVVGPRLVRCREERSECNRIASRTELKR